MKMQLKFDKQLFQDLFLEHVEKIVFTGVLVCFGLFVYSLIARPLYESTPENLAAAAKAAGDHVKLTPPETNVPAMTSYSDIAKSSHDQDVKNYEFQAPWSPLLFPARRKRSEPKVFAVEQLRGSADAGAIELKAGGPVARGRGQAIVGKRWIALVGLVPLADQLAAYHEAFKNNSLPKDVPNYLGYHIERAEVNGPSDDPAALQWTRLNLRDVAQEAKLWPATAAEVAPTEMTHPALDLSPSAGQPRRLGPEGGPSARSAAAFQRQAGTGSPEPAPVPTAAPKDDKGDEFDHPPAAGAEPAKPATPPAGAAAARPAKPARQSTCSSASSIFRWRRASSIATACNWG